MTTARTDLVDSSITRWYHCIIHCARRAPLLGEGPSDRKAWIEDRLQALAEMFAVSVGGFSVLDNQIQLLVRLDPDVARGWSDEDVVRRWARLYPPRDKARKLVPVSSDWVRAQQKDSASVAQARLRLQNIGWFMKSLKEPLARLANREEKTRGVFFEGRFKSVGILDPQSLVASSVSIDLSAVAAAVAEVPVASARTSLMARINHFKVQGRAQDLKAARTGKAPGPAAIARLEQKFWLCPIEDRPRHGSAREGMLKDVSLGNYLVLTDYTGRLFREGNPIVPRDVATILDRIGISEDHWKARLEKLSQGHLMGRFFATSRERLRDVASELGLKRVPNLGGCPVS
jgi:hypothetical protein